MAFTGSLISGPCCDVLRLLENMRLKKDIGELSHLIQESNSFCLIRELAVYYRPIVIGNKDLNIFQFSVNRNIFISINEINRTLDVNNFDPFTMQRKNAN
jgi:hypothetical protein